MKNYQEEKVLLKNHNRKRHYIKYIMKNLFLKIFNEKTFKSILY